MNFHQELQGAGLVKGVAQAFDRFLRVRTIFSFSSNHDPMILTSNLTGGDLVRWTPPRAEPAPESLRAARPRAHGDHHI